MSDELVEAVESALGAALGRSIRISGRQILSGGSINRTERLETDGGVFVLKSNRDPLSRLFASEAEGLEALRSSGTTLIVPRAIVHAEATRTRPAFLVLEYLESGRASSDFDEALGRGLATLHRSTGPRFGFTRDNYCGATPQPNPWTDNWVEFYREHRLGFQLRLAVDAGHFSSRDQKRYERLLSSLDRWLSEGPPALIHGDLWSGNLHVADQGRPAIIDPAVYYAHREAELGMMRLFGGFSARVYDAYEEAFPMEPDWMERNPLYQLYHLMNHVNLFGGSYRAGAMSIVERFAGAS